MDWKVVAARAFDRFIRNEEAGDISCPCGKRCQALESWSAMAVRPFWPKRYELAMALAGVGGISQGRGVTPESTCVMSSKQRTYRFKSDKERERVKRPD